VQIITLTLSDPEWERVFRIAKQAWPATVLDRQMSRNECCRRLLLAGLDSVPKANLSALERPLQPPGDAVMPKLPVAGD
jgi:DNA-directed RNA polymerase subunit N (RpoN/RPB10)